MDIEKKLEKYRAKKRREAYFNQATEKVKSLFTVRYRTNQVPMMSSNCKDNDNNSIKDQQTLLINEYENEHELSTISSDTESEDCNNSCRFSFIDIVTYFLYFVLWATLFIIFIKLQFGLVYLVMSALLGIYLNTRTGPRNMEEVSAYSVFNKNCESIDGTLKAEQFEREIRYGPAAIH